jgi:Ca2+-binding EF-hand superfamily protein
LIAKPIFEKLDSNSDGELSLQELVTAIEQYVPDLETSKYFIDEAYDDVTRLFQSVTAHGDGTIGKDLLTKHLIILSQDEEDSESSKTAIHNIFALLDDTDKNELTLNDVTVAFIRYYALQQAFYGEEVSD